MARYKNSNRKESKSYKVLEHLQTHGTITSWEAIELYGATRLSAIIYNLRKHYRINSVDEIKTDRYGNTSVFSKYVYRGEVG